MDFRFRNTLRKIATGGEYNVAMVGHFPGNYKRLNNGAVDPSELLANRGNNYFDALYDDKIRFGNVRNMDLPVDELSGQRPMHRPITKEELDAMRRLQAQGNAHTLFNSYTPQSRSAEDYLMQRGAENEALFKSGDLYKGGPRPKSKIPLPTNIKDPAKRKMLEQYGNIQVNNNITGGGRG